MAVNDKTLLDRLKPFRRVAQLSLFIIVGLVAIRIVSSIFFPTSLPNQLQDIITLSTSIIIESLPFIILGILISILVQVWLPDGWLMRILPKWPPLRRICISFLGVFFPVCECGNVPLARGLLAKGFTVPESLVFLLAAPILNPITIITTIQAFGSDTTIVIARIVGGFLIANMIGLIFSYHKNPQSLLTDNFAQQCETDATSAITQVSTKRQKISKSLSIFRRESNNIIPILFIAAVVAGLIQALVPREALLTLGANPGWSIIAMMLLAFIISICSNVDAFFALAFRSTFTPGSIVSFLTFGPVIDIKMLALMRTTYTTRLLIQITIIIALLSALLGLVVNYAF